MRLPLQFISIAFYFVLFLKRLFFEFLIVPIFSLINSFLATHSQSHSWDSLKWSQRAITYNNKKYNNKWMRENGWGLCAAPTRRAYRVTFCWKGWTVTGKPNYNKVLFSDSSVGCGRCTTSARVLLQLRWSREGIPSEGPASREPGSAGQNHLLLLPTALSSKKTRIHGIFYLSFTVFSRCLPFLHNHLIRSSEYWPRRVIDTVKSMRYPIHRSRLGNRDYFQTEIPKDIHPIFGLLKNRCLCLEHTSLYLGLD